MGISRPNFIVGIGGSAGALNAYKALLDALPSETGMASFLVSYISPPPPQSSVSADSVPSHENASPDGFHGDADPGESSLRDSFERGPSHGGKSFAQDMSAEVAGMPFSAQAAGWLDFVLPPDKIPEALQKLVSTLQQGRNAISTRRGSLPASVRAGKNTTVRGKIKSGKMRGRKSRRSRHR
jgi:hypothetical protein